MKKILYYVTLLAVFGIIFSGCTGKTSKDNFSNDKSLSDKPIVDKSTSDKSSVSVEDDGFSAAKPEKVIASDPEIFTIRVFSTLKGSTGSAYNFKTAVEEQFKKKYPKATIQ